MCIAKSDKSRRDYLGMDLVESRHLLSPFTLTCKSYPDRQTGRQKDRQREI